MLLTNVLKKGGQKYVLKSVAMMIIIGVVSCVLLCFEESVEEQEELVHHILQVLGSGGIALTETYKLRNCTVV